jgi:endonuclease/exonuclease/phosphatase family metal-dependent hydrolase
VPKFIKYVIIGIGCLIAAFALFLAVMTISAYRPADEVEITALKEIPNLEAAVPQSLSIMTWNIGYGGLGSEADFILDGGSMGKPESRAAVEENLSGIVQTINTLDVDYAMFQEVDQKAHRSFGIDEVELISSTRPDFAAWLSYNYRALYIPYPLSSPLGAVRSGLLTLSRYNAIESRRLQLPGNYNWPLRLFYPTRCIHVVRSPAATSDKYWYFINIHLSAYDSSGNLRSQQLEFIRSLMEDLYDAGNYVIVGGDWNSLFPGTDIDTFGAYTTKEENLFWIQSIPKDWTPEGWQWAVDPSAPSCRTLDKPYVKGENLGVLIDGFLLSPNLTAVSVKTLDLQFKDSDHNPVIVQVTAGSTSPASSPR